MISKFIQSKLTDGSITEAEVPLIEKLLTEIQSDESLLLAFQQESESRLAETFELSLFVENDTWSDYTIDEVDAVGVDAISVDASKVSAFQRNATVLPTFNEERYLDLGLLGKGGMGEVRKVRDTLLHRNIAIKIMDTQFSHTHRAIQRFIEEAQVGAQLQHPNIVPIHDFGKMPDGRYFFTMKEIQGREFSELIHELHNDSNDSSHVGSTVSLRYLIQIFHTVCETIAYSHSLKVIHRDLKPENIMVGSFGEVLVVDWGIAKVLGNRLEESSVQTERQITGANQTRFGMVAGTPAYMSPEQAMGRIDLVDERTDIYALGAILYEILSGHPAYQGDSALDILEQVRNSVNTVSNDEPIELPEVHLLDDETISPILIDICQQAMARDVSDRFATVQELSSAIWDWLEGARKHDRAMAEFQKSQEVFEQYQNALQTESDLWTIANDQYLHHGYTSLNTWKAREDYLHVRQHTKQLWREYTQLVDGALVYDERLPEANIEQAERLIQSIASAVARGELNRLLQLEEQFLNHLKYVSDEEAVILQKRLDSERNNSVTMLRIQRGTMIGRQEVLNNTIALIQNHSLVSLVGTAGMGKSRMAIEMAYHLKKDFEQIYFCDLSSATTALGLLSNIAKSMELELVNQDPLEQLTQVFINTKTLLVLDNLEQILEPCCTVIDHWYERCPQLRILTTTRLRLRLPFEQSVVLSPLTEFEALELFEIRGQEVNPSFQIHERNREILGRMIQDLDSLPLAIELAASRLNMLTASEIADRLTERFSILRSRTSTVQPLDAALDWSWDILSDGAKHLLAQVSIFQGGFTLEAAEQVVYDECLNGDPTFDILEDLYENSLLLKQTTFDGSVRFSMLQSISDYARSKLNQSGMDLEHLHQRYAQYYARFGTRDGIELIHMNPQALQQSIVEQQNCMNAAFQGKGMASVQCCLAALQSLSVTGPSQFGIDFACRFLSEKRFTKHECRSIENKLVKLYRMSGQVAQTLKYRDDVSEMHRELSTDCTSKYDVASIVLMADECLELGNIAESQADYETAQSSYNQAIDLYRSVNHTMGEVQVHLNLGTVFIQQSCYDLAQHEFESALNISIEQNLYMLSNDAHLGLAQVLQRQGRYQESIELLNQAILAVQHIKDRFREIQLLGLMGRLHLDLSEYHKAKTTFQSVLELSIQVGDRKSEGVNLGMKGQAHAQMGEYTQASESFAAAIDILSEVGDKIYLASFLSAIGVMYKDLNQYELAIQYVHQSVDLSLLIDDKRGAARTIGNLANIYQNLGHFEGAIAQYNKALLLGKEIGDSKGVCINLGNLGNVYQNLGETDKAIESFEQAANIAQELGDKSIEAINRGNLGVIYVGQNRLEEAIEAMELAVQITREIGDRRNEGVFVGNLGDIFAKSESWEQAMVNLSLGIEITRETFPVAAGAFLGSLGWVKSQVNRFEEAMAHFEDGEDLVSVYPWEYVKFLCKKSKVFALNQDVDTAHQVMIQSIEIAEGLNVNSDTEVWQSIEEAKGFIKGI